MKTPLSILALSLSTLVLGACASTHDRQARAAPERVMQPGEVRFEQDAQYVMHVERIARRRGIHVQWVHPPTRRVVKAE